MDIIRTIEEMRSWRQKAGRVALVPTMGNLHEGHLALVREAKKQAERVVVSIFVNRLQFGQGEDFDSYPRTFEADRDKLAAAGVDALFLPDERELYPRIRQDFNVEPPHIQDELCGAFRPGHFRGVATVVTKLFNIAEDPSERNDVAAANPEKVLALQQRLNALAKDAAKSLFLVDQFKVVMKNMKGEPVLPTDDEYIGVDGP